jgi:hypothetical protein
VRGILVTVRAITDDGEASDVIVEWESVEIPKHDTLHAMYRLLECHTVDVVRLAPDLDMWLDDEGMFSGIVNPAASIIAAGFGFSQQLYYGHVLYLGGADRSGNTMGLKPPRERELLQKFHGLAMTGRPE